MERTLISFNVPNLITVPLMAFGGFLIAALVWQFAQRAGLAKQSDQG
jgi:hypothetical protein